MSKDEGGMLKRIRGAFRAEAVVPPPEYIKRTAQERRQIIERAFGSRQEQREEQPPDADSQPAGS